jgi:excisionase family DNA binding protein
MTAPVYRRQEMISVQSIAARWNMSKSFVYQLIESGKLAAFKFGGALRVHESKVAEYEESAKYDAGA